MGPKALELDLKRVIAFNDPRIVKDIERGEHVYFPEDS